LKLPEIYTAGYIFWHRPKFLITSLSWQYLLFLLVQFKWLCQSCQCLPSLQGGSTGVQFHANVVLKSKRWRNHLWHCVSLTCIKQQWETLKLRKSRWSVNEKLSSLIWCDILSETYKMSRLVLTAYYKWL